jgi:hypothetical protein
MALRSRNLFLGLSGMVLTACGVGAQVKAGVGESNLRRPVTRLVVASEPQSTLEDELRQMSAQAGVIFAGQVLAVHPQSALGVGAGWVEVEFRVEEAILGCVDQQTYKLREWAGLWAGGTQRYRVGQRLLMMLHAPGPSGLSSPVGGQDGAIPIGGTGVAPKPEDEFVGSGEQAVDLRWLQTRLLRSPANGGRLNARPVASAEPTYVGREREPMVTRKNGQGVRNNLRFATGQVAGSELEEGPTAFEVNPPSSTTLTEGATLRGILAMLGAWEAQQTNAAQ